MIFIFGLLLYGVPEETLGHINRIQILVSRDLICRNYALSPFFFLVLVLVLILILISIPIPTLPFLVQLIRLLRISLAAYQTVIPDIVTADVVPYIFKEEVVRKASDTSVDNQDCKGLRVGMASALGKEDFNLGRAIGLELRRINMAVKKIQQPFRFSQSVFYSRSPCLRSQLLLSNLKLGILVRTLSR